MVKQFQWFPGHMSKTIKDLKELSRKVDFFLVILDARAPKSSFVQSLRDLIENKEALFILNKVDLANRSDFLKLKEDSLFKDKKVILLNSKSQKSKKIIMNEIKKISSKRLLKKGCIIGVPNVGKSTILNLLKGKRTQLVSDKPGVTRKNEWFEIMNTYWLLDSPGILVPSFFDEQQGIKLASIGSIKYETFPIHKVYKWLLERVVHNEQFSHDEVIQVKFIKNFRKGKFGKYTLDSIGDIK